VVEGVKLAEAHPQGKGKIVKYGSEAMKFGYLGKRKQREGI